MLVWWNREIGDVFTVLLQLFPHKFRDIMKLSQSNHEMLPKLQKIVDNEPWVLGFSRVSTTTV